ncbi:hypothetical protein PGTUg99_016575 [Puccinia graminis f. sp. tritici]|uniref:Uncharacterized protein n=1 Tax=Puccinia graminis f. sp. tritici TaxID=56615 RepID=A0A5B0RZH6_PUCGR|nr:hypothetical protein PGTUg99_016575 [Puccinia graminis f. sp. tritici]
MNAAAAAIAGPSYPRAPGITQGDCPGTDTRAIERMYPVRIAPEPHGGPSEGVGFGSIGTP